MILIIWCVSLAVIFLGFTLFIVLTKKKAFAKVKNIIPGSLLYNIKRDYYWNIFFQIRAVHLMIDYIMKTLIAS